MPTLDHLQTRSGRLSYALSGSGRPAIILFSGSGLPLEVWTPLYPEIERIGRVLAWNRPGLKGDVPREPQTGGVVLSSLRQLLSHTRLEPPYILVAHSLGGMYANLFARVYAPDVAGVLFLEAAHPRDRQALRRSESKAAQAIGSMLAIPQRLFRGNLHAEVECLDETAREIESAGAFPPVPITVITGARPAPRWLLSAAAAARRRAHQQALARLSPLSEHILANHSGHFPQRSEPQLVLQALRRLRQRVGYAVSPL